MKVLILGASGYVGSRLAVALKTRGDHVTVQMRSTPAVGQAWLTQFDRVIVADPAEENAQLTISRSEFDAVVFAIAIDYQVAESSLNRAFDTNVGLVCRYLELLSGRTKSFIYFSTQQVYGTLLATLREEQICRPTNVNALTHHLAEQVAEYFRRNSKAMICSLRLSNMYGAPAYSDAKFLRFAVTDLCHQAMHSRRIQLKSDGSPQRDFIDAGDVCSAVQTLLDHPEAAGKYATYNLGSGQTYSIREIAVLVQEQMKHLEGGDVGIVGPDGAALTPLAKVPARQFQCDISKLRALGFQPRGDLRTGIAETFRYLGQQSLTV